MRRSSALESAASPMTRSRSSGWISSANEPTASFSDAVAYPRRRSRRGLTSHAVPSSARAYVANPEDPAAGVGDIPWDIGLAADFLRTRSEIFKTLGPGSRHDAGMVNLQAASDFMATHARLLDRRRFEVVTDGAPPDAVLAALAAYRNPDGGYSWGLEPDLRDSRSQPGPALHAFEVFEDISPATSPRAVELCDWLATVSLDDGGVPFAVPVGSDAGCAPFWANADPTVSSLQITAIVAGMAHRVAAQDPAVAGHPWLSRATDYCLAAIDKMTGTPFAMELAFAVQLLDRVHADRPEAGGLLDRLREHIPADGMVPVRGGSEGEAMRPLDFAPFPD